MAELTSAVCSVTATRRRRFYWAAWWSGEPTHNPFRKPDAANGGARSRAAALAEAERVAGRHLTLVDGYWARAHMSWLRGEPVPPPPAAGPRAERQPTAADPTSAWSVLELETGASALAIRQAFRKKALETHPDQGGDAASFRRVMQAFERLTRKRKSARRTVRRPG